MKLLSGVVISLKSVALFCAAAAIVFGSTGCNPSAALIPKEPDPEDIQPFDPSTAQLFYTLTLQQTESLLKNHPETIIIDIRSPIEFAKGHLPNAMNIDVKSDGFRDEIQSVDKGAVILLCGTSKQTRTELAVTKMKAQGFQQVHRIGEGFEIWKENGFPFIQDVP